MTMAEDRCVDIGYEEAVWHAHDVGLDYKPLLEEGLSDLVPKSIFNHSKPLAKI